MYLNRKQSSRILIGTSVATAVFLMSLQLPLSADIPFHKLAPIQKFDFLYWNSLTDKNKGFRAYFGDLDVWVAKYQFASNGRHKVLWRKQIGTKETEQPWGVASDNKGNVFITGESYGSLGGSSLGGKDGWIAKYSPEGTLLWIKHFGTPSDEYATSIAIDTDGNALISGWTGGGLGGTQKGGTDAWVAKYSPSGSLLWIKQLGTDNYDFSESIAVDKSSNVFIAGHTNGSLGSAQQGGGDVWIAKYSLDGTLLWIKQFGTSSSDNALDIATDKNGNVIISGVTAGALKFRNKGSLDNFVAKYSSQGVQLWVQQLGSNRIDISEDVAIDQNGNAYLVGWINDKNYNFSDPFIVKLNPYGTLVWKKFLRQFPGFPLAIAMDNKDNIFISGGSLPPSIRYDAIFAKFNKYGKQLSFFLDGSDKPGDFSRDIAIDPSGNVLATGHTQGNFSKD